MKKLLALATTLFCCITLTTTVGAAANTPRLTAPTITSASNTITWAPVAGADGYNVYRDNRYIKTVTQRSFTPEQNGEFHVTSFDKDTSPTRYSTRSNTVRITVANTTRAELDIAAPLPAPRWIWFREYLWELQWESVEGADGYNVYRDGRYIATVGQSTPPDGASPWILSPSFSTSVYGTYYVVAFDTDSNPTRYSAKSRSIEAKNQCVMDC